MKNLKKLLLSAIISIITISSHAQTVTIKSGSEGAMDLIKGSSSLNFTAGGERFFITKYFKAAEMHYDLLRFSNTGSVMNQDELKIQGGVFNNTFSIDEVLPLGTKAYAMIEHLDKAAGKNTLLARVFDSPGSISTNETELMSTSFEKIMNSGTNHAVVSPDKNTLAVIVETPFVKEQPCTFKVALFDKDLKKTGENQFNLPGENKKNKNITALVNNNGTVYILKKTFTNKGETALTVYQYDALKGGDVKEYVIEMVAPDQLFSYTYSINPNGELIVAGTYYKRQTLTSGDTKATGVFFFTNAGMSKKNLKTFPLDQPIANLTARKILVNGNTLFLTAEQFKEERISQPAGTMNFDYDYNYTHKSEFFFGLNTDGTKKFQIEIAKDFTARNIDQHYYSGYFICNGKLTVVYNDQTKKYTPNDSYHGYEIPVLVQITNDGLMQSPVVFKDNPKLDRYYKLYPSFSFQESENEITMLAGMNESMKMITLKID